jgi:DNA-binding FadR family transcriptional regulator
MVHYDWLSERNALIRPVSTVTPSRNTRDRARQLAAELHRMLERHIDDGRLRPGEKLASERDLASQFGASRTVVRNALVQLHRAGKIARKVGHGTIVVGSPESHPALPLFDTSPAELLEFRLPLEPSHAEAMVLNASARDIQKIWECVEGGNVADSWPEWERWDRSFHLSLVAATHNRLAITLYQAIIAIRHEQPWLRLKQGHTDVARWQAYQEQHRRIANCIAARDTNAAADALRDHLVTVRAKMLSPDRAGDL